MLANERLQLSNQLRVLAEHELGLDPLLQRRQPRLLQPRDLRLRERLVDKIRQGRPTPQSQRLPQPRGSSSRITVPHRPSTLRDQRLETVHIKLGTVEV